MKRNRISRLLLVSALLLSTLLIITMYELISEYNMDSSLSEKKALTIFILSQFVMILFLGILIVLRKKIRKNIYISYSEKDADIASKIKAELIKNIDNKKKKNLQIISRNNIEYGDAIYETMEHNIIRSDIAILVLSDEYLKEKYCLEEFTFITHNGIKYIPVILSHIATDSDIQRSIADKKALFLVDYDEITLSEGIKELSKAIIK